jgi:hypothetical protein
MIGLPPDSLCQACQIFLRHAYPGGEETIPSQQRMYLGEVAGRSLESLLACKLCQPLAHIEGKPKGYALRLGRAGYPHLKMQVVDCDHQQTWVFAVDTHDTGLTDPHHAQEVADLKACNARLKQEIEAAWEAAGLLTFNALLRRALG